jgi:hypothetical protein
VQILTVVDTVVTAPTYHILFAVVCEPVTRVYRAEAPIELGVLHGDNEVAVVLMANWS